MMIDIIRMGLAYPIPSNTKRLLGSNRINEPIEAVTIPCRNW